MSLAAVLALGFFLGMRHATDADHVVAVSTIVSRQRTVRAAAPIGMLWGVGHTLTILLVGGAILLFGIVIPPRLGLGMELSVALLLVLLGALNVRSVLRDARTIAGAHAAPPDTGHIPGSEAHALGGAGHTSGGVAHALGGAGHMPGGEAHALGGAGHMPGGEAHALGGAGHMPGGEAHALGGAGHMPGGVAHALGGVAHALGAGHNHAHAPSGLRGASLRPLYIGIVHGLAGSAAVALLVLGAIGDATLGLAYLLVFGAGTIAGMVLITTALAVPIAAAAQRFTQFHRALGVATGLASVALGAVLVYEIGFVHGLFTAEPHWLPH